MNGQYQPGDVVLGNWTLKHLIGAGSFGRVFEAEREDYGTLYKSAVKIITIPQSQSEVRNARSEGMDDDSVTAYFRSFVEEMVREFALMSRLEGTANVVGYKDHTVIRHESAIGWDIVIRMELLTPLLDYTAHSKFTRRDAIKLGIDMCKALELCQKLNIIHRDIKPENIFISELGDFKLGDFGIARTAEKTTSGLSKKGTYTYMAPEVYRGSAYGSGVDIYSLGLVLYRFLNGNRSPFLPEAPSPITHSAREAALARRISGAALPPPRNADGRLAEIVLKACAYDPKDRYSSPGFMRQELEAILYSREEAPLIYPQGDTTPVEPVEYIEDNTPAALRGVPAAAADAAVFEETMSFGDETEADNMFSPMNETKKLNCWFKSVDDARGNQIKCTGYNTDGTVFGSVEFEYDSFGNQIKRVNYKADGGIAGWRNAEYNENGNVTRKTHYNSVGDVIDWMQYEYNANNKLIKRTSYDAHGEITGWKEVEYDTGNALLSESQYNEVGQKDVWTKYEYVVNGCLHKRTSYNANGFTEEIIYAPNGNPVSQTIYYPDGSIRYQWP